MSKFKGRAEDQHAAHNLRDALFTNVRTGSDNALWALRDLGVYITHIEGSLIALNPASQALWDSDFVDVVNFATEEVERMHAWVNQQIKVRSPQALIVPMR